MQRLLGLATATALVLSAMLAHADEITGYVTNINTTQNRFEVGDTLFNAAPNNTVGTPLDEIKAGRQGDGNILEEHLGWRKQRALDRPGRARHRDTDAAGRVRHTSLRN